MKTVTLPRDLYTLEVADGYGNIYSLFYGCYSIQDIILPENSTHLKSIDGVIFDSTETILFAYPAAKTVEGGYTLPSTVKQIAPYAFFGYKGTSITLNDGLNTIGKGAFYNSSLTTVSIPASVTAIDDSAFIASESKYGKLTEITFAEDSMLTTIGSGVFQYQLLTEVTIPNTVTTVGNNLFYTCKQLKKVTLSSSMSTIPQSMFYSCSALEEVIIQSDITSIGNTAFSWSGIKKIDLPSSVSALGTQAFYNCQRLEYITFPEDMNLASIGNMMFYQGYALKEITLPASVSTIEYGAFRKCTSLKYVDMSKTQITELSSNTNSSVNGVPTRYGFFEECTKLVEVYLPEGLEVMESNLFKGCTSLTEIRIPEATHTIQELVFENCKSLETVLFAQNSKLESIGEYFFKPDVYDENYNSGVFRNTTALKEINIPEGVEYIGGNAFENSGIEAITFPSTLTAISNSMFKNCQGLTQINIPGTVSNINDDAFLDCFNLTSVTLNEGNEYLGANAFGNCAGITSITIPSSMLRMGGNPFSNCVNITNFVLEENENFIQDETGVLYDGNMRTVIFYPSYLESESYTMPDTVFELAACAFTSSKLKSIVISDNIKVIPDGCFKDNINLESVYIPLSVTYVGDEAFRNCVKLKSAAIPSLCTYLGDYAFENCTSLESFDFGKRNTVLEVGTHVFNNCTSLTSITDPEGIDKLTDYMFANTVFEIINLPATITNISGVGVFSNCKNLRIVKFADNTVVEKWSNIGDKAFYNCEKLESIRIPSGVSEIGGWDEGQAFANCTSLRYVYIPETVSYIGGGAFYNCTALQTVEFDERLFWDDEQDSKYEYGIYGIGVSAFYNCINLENFQFPYGCFSDIYPHAFENCSKITGVVYAYGYVWFYGTFLKNCTGISEIHFDEGFDGNYNADCDLYYNETELTGTAECGSFVGWTSNQKIFFDGHTYEDLLDSFGGIFDAENSEEVMFAYCSARIFDCDGNEFIYDHVTGGLISVIDAEGNVIYEPEA
jgi:hypothetical protein